MLKKQGYNVVRAKQLIDKNEFNKQDFAIKEYQYLIKGEEKFYNKRIDYALFVGGNLKAFVEVKSQDGSGSKAETL